MKTGVALLFAVLCAFPAPSALADLTLYVDTTNQTFCFDGSMSAFSDGGTIEWDSNNFGSTTAELNISSLLVDSYLLYGSRFTTEPGFFTISLETNASGVVTVIGNGEWQSYAGWGADDISMLEACINSQFTSVYDGSSYIPVEAYASVPEPAACAWFAGIAALGMACAARRISRKK